MWSRVQGWNEKHLSMARWEVLIKSVLQAIPTYVMSCFKLSDSILEEVEKIIRRFWWGSKSSKGISWLAWGRLCRPKSQGGMVFWDMESFNLVLLTKQAWRITTRPDLLMSQVFKARYFPDTPFSWTELGDRPSLTWRSILSTRSHLEAGTSKRIGNGLNTSIWADVWLTSEGTGRIITTRSSSSSFPNTVPDLIDWEQGSWSIELLEQHLWPCDIQRVLQVPIGTPASEDGSYWELTKHVRFTVR